MLLTTAKFSGLESGLLLGLVSAHRAKFLQIKHDARKLATEMGFIRCGVTLHVGEWSNRVFEAIEAQWTVPRRPPEFDWREIHRRYREPDQLDFAIWTDDRLAAVGLALVRSEYVLFAFFEADPRNDCPLKGKRILIALDAVAAYVQGSGREEIRVEPANDKLVEVYQTVYEFEVVSPRKGRPYCRKRL